MKNLPATPFPSSLTNERDKGLEGSGAETWRSGSPAPSAGRCQRGFSRRPFGSSSTSAPGAVAFMTWRAVSVIAAANGIWIITASSLSGAIRTASVRYRTSGRAQEGKRELKILGIRALALEPNTVSQVAKLPDQVRRELCLAEARGRSPAQGSPMSTVRQPNLQFPPRRDSREHGPRTGGAFQSEAFQARKEGGGGRRSERER